jgi:integrase
MVAKWWHQAIANKKVTIASKAYKLLSTTMGRAIDDGLVLATPCRVKGAHSASTGKEIVIPSPEDVKAIIDAMHPRFKTMVTVAAASGLRFGELTALTRDDVTAVTRNERKAYAIAVNKAVTFVKGEFVVGKPKSRAGVRTVELSTEFTETIDLHMKSVGEKATDLVFISDGGTYIRHDVFAKAWTRALATAGIEGGFTPHGLRHFAGTEFERAGASLAEIKNRLGDSSTEAVMRYLHATDRAGTLVENTRRIL